MTELPISEYHEIRLNADPYYGYHKHCLLCGRFVKKEDWSNVSKPICDNHYDVIEEEILDTGHTVTNGYPLD